MDCSKIKVVKKDGTREDFNVQKVLSAISKSAERAMITFSRAERNFICEFIRTYIHIAALLFTYLNTKVNYFFGTTIGYC